MIAYTFGQLAGLAMIAAALGLIELARRFHLAGLARVRRDQRRQARPMVGPHPGRPAPADAVPPRSTPSANPRALSIVQPGYPAAGADR